MTTLAIVFAIIGHASFSLDPNLAFPAFACAFLLGVACIISEINQ